METLVGELPTGTTNPAPVITCWLPERERTGSSIVILPGGGYGALAEHEGRGYAEYFAAAGIASFVVTYRLGTDGFRHPAMLEDAPSARADKLGLDPQRLGIMGSSAGGHLASQALVAWHTYESDVSLRPDFGIMCYPVIASQGPFVHVGSMRNLAGQDPSSETLNMLSSDLHVGPDTPPCFLWHTGEDAAVPLENSMLFASALRVHGVPFELHLYGRGQHGLGLATPFDWGDQCLRWIGEVTEWAA